MFLSFNLEDFKFLVFPSTIEFTKEELFHKRKKKEKKRKRFKVLIPNKSRVGIKLHCPGSGIIKPKPHHQHQVPILTIPITRQP